ncbi:MAG: fibronectin type III domain-containing protein [Candidatus Sabulitectum sp.]|nr:fibronectin type III domain-containing protein [Candidatus Sabulitectum sp.]
MKRLAVFTALLVLITACGPDNPFEPDNPSPSALTGIVSPSSSTTAELGWTGCPDSDFSSYTLYRSVSPGISNNSGSAAVIFTTENKASTEYLDDNLEPGSTWYYALKTTNEGGGASWSNEVSVKLPSKN